MLAILCGPASRLYGEAQAELPYALAPTGEALAITVDGGNTALDVKPDEFTDTEWDYANFGAFGSGCFVPTYSEHGAFVIAGSGGHEVPDHIGATLVDFSTGKWARLDNSNGVDYKQASPPVFQDTDTNGDPWYEITGSTVPAPPHPYGCMVFSPAGTKGSVIHITKTATTAQSVISDRCHAMDLATREWTRASTNGSGRANFEADAVWDEARGLWWFTQQSQHSYQSVSYLDNADATFKTLGSFDFPSGDIEGPARCVLHSGLLVRPCGNTRGLWLFDPDDANDGWIELTVTGTMPNQANRWAQYSDGKYYGIPSSGGNTLTRITPPVDPKSGTWACDTVEIGGNTLPTGQRGSYTTKEHYGRLINVPSIDRLVWIPGGSEANYTIKPA